MTQSPERPIAVYRIPAVALWAAIFAALLLQVSLPVILPLARLFDLPLLLVIYFSVMRRNKVYGTLLGAGAGLAQDAFARGFLGMFGMAKTVVGYVAAWASVKFNLEPIGMRVALAAFLVLLHGLVYAGLGRMREPPSPFQPLDLASAVLVNAALALVLFPLLDRFRR